MIPAKRMNYIALPRPVERRAENILRKPNFRLLIGLVILHFPLGLFDYYAGPAALLHPAAAFGVGLYWALQKKVRLHKVALAIGYLVGVEILWRMAQVPIFWEFGKYGSSVIMVVALLKRGRRTIPALPLIYFAALIPASILTFMQFDLLGAKDTLSFSLSGPLFLMVSCWFFSNLTLNENQLRSLFTAFIIPLLSVAFVTFFFTMSIKDIQFSDESNFATSGGFGPNQVSAMLGLGLFLATFSLLALKNDRKSKVFFAIAAVFFAAQSMMTFSRGGVYNAGGALLLVALFEFGDPLKATKRIVPVAALILLFMIFVFPVLNEFTGGGLEERFQDTQSTHRAEIAESDIDLFLEHPILGVGIGAAYSERSQILGYKAVSHTEFSRLLSEHGAFGVIAILMLTAMVAVNFRRSRPRLERALIIGAAAWSILFMLNAGMRLAAPSALFGMTFITIAEPMRRTRRRILRPIPIEESLRNGVLVFSEFVPN